MTLDIACIWFVLGILIAALVYCVYVVLFVPVNDDYQEWHR